VGLGVRRLVVGRRERRRVRDAVADDESGAGARRFLRGRARHPPGAAARAPFLVERRPREKDAKNPARDQDHDRTTCATVSS
jgi:hypothetical protein